MQVDKISGSNFRLQAGEVHIAKSLVPTFWMQADRQAGLQLSHLHSRPGDRLYSTARIAEVPAGSVQWPGGGCNGTAACPSALGHRATPRHSDKPSAVHCTPPHPHLQTSQINIKGITDNIKGTPELTRSGIQPPGLRCSRAAPPHLHHSGSDAPQHRPAPQNLRLRWGTCLQQWMCHLH